MSWSDAAQTCESLGGHLAIQHSDELHRVISEELMTRGDADTEWWIGLRDHLLPEWTFADGQTVLSTPCCSCAICFVNLFTTKTYI